MIWESNCLCAQDFAVMTILKSPWLRRLFSTEASSIYPYSNNALFPPPPIRRITPELLKGKGLMAALYKAHPPKHVRGLLNTVFSRDPRKKLRPGSIVSVLSGQAPTTFTGVLLAVRRRGIATSFLLRNIVQRTGTEVQYFLASPHIKGIKIHHRAVHRRGKRMGRAKLYYLRDNPQKMAQLSANMKNLPTDVDKK